MDLKDGPGGHLSIEQAAVLLGVSPRHVRRLIATGQLAGSQRPYRTHRDFVDAYRRRQQGLCGDVVDSADKTDSGPAPNGHAQSDRDVLLFALREIERLALELGRREATAEGLALELRRREDVVMDLCREVARLEAERASCTCRGCPRGQGGQQEGHGGQRSGALARLGPWLRR